MRCKVLLLVITLGCSALLTSGGGTTSPALAIDTTVVGEWSFDEGSGSTVEDSSPYGNDGVAYNAEWVTGVSGFALHFDGTDASYVEVPNKPELSPSRHVIIDVWVNPDSYPAHFDASAILWKGQTQDTTGCHGNRSYTLWLPENGDLIFASTPEDETCQRMSYTPTGLIPLNEWSHVRVDLNTREGKVRIFVNDQLVTEDSYPQEPIKSGDSPLRIGGRFWSADNQPHFSGSIDEVKIEVDAAPVGGIAEFAQLGPSAKSGVGGSLGSNALALAGLATGAALLAVGGWYARRRWLT
jgi:hypothetical protein